MRPGSVLFVCCYVKQPLARFFRRRRKHCHEKRGSKTQVPGQLARDPRVDEPRARVDEPDRRVFFGKPRDGQRVEFGNVTVEVE